MKIIAISVAVSALALAAPALAQSDTAPGITGYGNLGYAQHDAGSIDTGAISGRLGARFGRYFGVEGEAGFGVKSDKNTVAGVQTRSSLKHDFAAYGVGFLPVTPRLDLFARAGYGTTKFGVTTAGTEVSNSRSSWNYGGGAQYFLTANDGLRADYTRESFVHGPGHDNVWGLSYVRKF